MWFTETTKKNIRLPICNYSSLSWTSVIPNPSQPSLPTVTPFFLRGSWLNWRESLVTKVYIPGGEESVLMYLFYYRSSRTFQWGCTHARITQNVNHRGPLKEPQLQVGNPSFSKIHQTSTILWNQLVGEFPVLNNLPTIKLHNFNDILILRIST